MKLKSCYQHSNTSKSHIDLILVHNKDQNLFHQKKLIIWAINAFKIVFWNVLDELWFGSQGKWREQKDVEMREFDFISSHWESLNSL